MKPQREFPLQYGSIYDIPLHRLSGEPDSLETYRGNVLLAVNVASKCGRTPQYAGLQTLFDRYAGRGFTVLGFPCNQFGREEPGSASEIAKFCSTNYGITFPMFAKLQVNGPRRHPLYQVLTACPDEDGQAGDVAWNFEKFLITKEGSVVRRYRNTVTPENPKLVSAIETLLQTPKLR
jgi:glutathione peroxidase